MSDPLQTSPVHPAQPSVMTASQIGCCLLTLLFSVTAAGCIDSHSGDFVEFSELEQPATPVEPADSLSLVGQEDDTQAAVDNTEQPDEFVAERQDVTAGESTSEAAEAPADSLPIAGSAESESKGIRLLIPHRQFRMEGNAVRATFDDIDLLKVLNMDPVPVDAMDHFPDWLGKLNGAHVRIRGYMRPGFDVEDITEFLFVRDNGECCYGPLPKIYDMIAVELAEGESTDLIEGTPFDVEGTMRIEPHADDVELYGLFFIDDGVIVE